MRPAARARRAPLIALALLLPGVLLPGSVIPKTPCETPGASRPLKTRNVVFITVDGWRIQEMFGGMDGTIARKEKDSGIYDLERARRRFWRDTPDGRRAALLPFFWGTLAPQGVVLGNREKGSSVVIRNPHRYSTPGYLEILTGQPQPETDASLFERNPHRTFLEFIQEQAGLSRTQVAVVASWAEMRALAASRPEPFFINAGYEPVPPALATPRMTAVSDLQDEIMTGWETGRSDAVTFNIALEYLKMHRPRLLYIALDESDDWAHARRYDRVLDYMHVVDGWLRVLWETLQASDAYRGRTTIVLTTDHGRGLTPRDWIEHDEAIEGAQDIWVAVIGPDAPRTGEAGPAAAVTQSDVAATVIRLFGLDDRKFNPAGGAPIAAAFE